MELAESDRNRFLDERCSGDLQLRREVEALLGFAEASCDFLETPAIEEVAAAWSDATVRMPDGSPHEPRDERSDRPVAVDNARFVAGDIVAGRYRIVGLLGRGGMGEVYRADDLKLSQPVALKFLAETLSQNGAALARFHREVSTARQISHRHVCRVYDIGEHAGVHFLSMEYVRGEELASLLKRIGRLPVDKAVDVARQLCAGLAAIHAAGVLHRDLKPANVMIDERGDVRITDFGVAALSEAVHGREAMIGTPAYMAPEQFQGGELTTRSDIYALGLILYEAFTGNRPFNAMSLDEIARTRIGDGTPTRPSSWVTDLDPIVERVILRCLERDPQRRPATALEVAAALPGGDPLAAALAAGETPSPQMVAAAEREGSLRPSQAALLLGVVLGSFGATAFLADLTMLHRRVRLDKSPEVLRSTATDIARETGAVSTPADSAAGFVEDYAALRYLRADGAGAGHRPGEPLPLVQFWYRESPRSLEAINRWTVTEEDPPRTIAGMISIRLDSTGRLLYFEAVPPSETPPGPARPADWRPLFARAGLTMSAFRGATPRWTPPQHSDQRLAWTGFDSRRPDVPLRIEAASLRGKPSYFEIIFPWQTPQRQDDPADEGAFGIVLFLFHFGAMTLATVLAWRNIRLGRGDQRGAWRIAVLMFLSRMVYWVFAADHLRGTAELTTFIAGLQSALYWSALTGLLYLALEPFLRRRWPESLISWTRLLAGDIRDPLVGRDVLIGAVFGLVAIVAGQIIVASPMLEGRPLQRVLPTSDLLAKDGLVGVPGFVRLLLNQTAASVLVALVVATVVFFFALVTRRNSVAMVLSWIVFYAALNMNVGQDTLLGNLIAYTLGAVAPSLMVIALFRFGLLCLMSCFFFNHLTAFYPVTTEWGAWYATSYLMALAVFAAVAIHAFYMSLAGQRLLQTDLLDR